MHRLLGPLLLGVSFSIQALGCGSSQSAPPQDPVVVAGQQLQGTWRLLSFRPTTPLEPPLQSLLDAQMSTLTITFEGDLFTAMGAGINTTGRILIQGVDGEFVRGTLYDRMGAGHALIGRFQGNQFHFSSLNPPWQGTGVIEKAAQN